MKHFLTSILLIATINTSAQLGISAGVNWSYFTGGDNTYSGTQHAAWGIKTGIYYNHRITKAHNVYEIIDSAVIKHENRIATPFSINTGLFYQHLGAKNPKESPETFSTYHIHLPVTLAIQCHDFRFQFGGYVNRVVYAKNHTFSGVNTFGWSVKKWDYYHKYIFGLTGGIGYDLKGATIQINGMRGLRKVQTKVYPDKNMGYDAAADISLYVPLNTFK